MITNKNFVLIEEYDNVPDMLNLSLVLKRFCPQIYLDRFTLCYKKIKKQIDDEFFNTNYVKVMVTNNLEKFNKNISQSPGKAWNTIRLQHSDNYILINWALYRENDVNNMVFVFYLDEFQIKRHSIPYSKTGKRLSHKRK